MIPTFEPGQRVRVTPRPAEGYGCPHCGVTYSEKNRTPFNGRIVLGHSGFLSRCLSCGKTRPVHEGEYLIAYEGEYRPTNARSDKHVAPWTWLTPLDEETP